MALTASPKEVPQPQLPVVSDAVGDSAQKLLMHFGLSLPDRPFGEMPTLVGSPNDLDLHTADRLHNEASRWLEYVEGVTAMSEARLLVARHDVSSLEAKHLFTKKKKDFIPLLSQEEFDELQALRQNEVQLHAATVILNGARDALTKVVNKASRSITRHMKTNPAGF